MGSLGTILLTFLLTGILGNRLLTRLQSHTWLNQQRLLSEDKRYENLLQLFSEISDCGSKRLTSMSRLANSLNFDDLDIIRTRLREYDKSQKLWNESLNGIYARLKTNMSFSQALRLEQDVHENFYELGRKLEILYRDRAKGIKPSKASLNKLSASLNLLQFLLGDFNRDCLIYLNEERKRIFHGSYVDFSETTLEMFSTWELFKYLFSPREQYYSIFRAPFDIRTP